MSNYQKSKDIFTQRRNSQNTGFEEWPIIVNPNSVLFLDGGNNLVTVDTASLMQYVSAGSSSYALTASYVTGISETASYARQALSASYANNVSNTASYSQFALSASYAANVPETASYSLRALTASYAQNASDSASYAVSSSFVSFNGNRSIKRTGYVGLNVGGVDVITFLNNFFFPFVPATVAISPIGTTLYQQGTNPTFTVTSTVLNNDETVFGTASVFRNGILWNSSSVPPLIFSFNDSITSNNSYVTYVQTDNNGSPTLINSNTINASFVFPYVWGVNSVAGLSGTALYNAFTKQVVTSGNKTVNLSGNATYIYFAYPATYPALTSILDPNGFETISNFEYSSSVSVSSQGLFSDWTTNYRVYRTRLVSDPNGNYQFRQ